MKSLIAVFTLIFFSLSAQSAPVPFPVFLKSGFSSILEFDETPVKVVLGDGQSFQVEKLDHSLAIKTLTPYASTNMFVYFKIQEPRLFILTASEDAVPTYYKKFETAVQKPGPRVDVPVLYRNGIKLLSAHFDPKKDYLTVEVELSSNSSAVIKPRWEWTRMTSGQASIAPSQLWSERKDVQKDSRVRARFIFAKPNVPRNLKAVSLVVPLLSSPVSLVVPLGGKAR